jgi:hypothetical protein
MANPTAETDMGLGLGLAFGLVATLAAIAMYLGHADQVLTGWAFAVAVVAGALGIAVLHIYE